MHKPCILILIVCLIAVTACGQPAPVAQAPTLTLTAAATSAPTATPQPTDTPLPTATTPPTATPTQTAAPTDTPSPSPTPTPAASVTGDSINVRGGPGTVYPVVGQAKKGETLPVVSRTEDGAWLEVVLVGGKQGWVSAKLVAVNVSSSRCRLPRLFRQHPNPRQPKRQPHLNQRTQRPQSWDGSWTHTAKHAAARGLCFRL